MYVYVGNIGEPLEWLNHLRSIWDVDSWGLRNCVFDRGRAPCTGRYNFGRTHLEMPHLSSGRYTHTHTHSRSCAFNALCPGLSG